MGSRPIAESFNQYFSMQMADTPPLRDEVYRIRYAVYGEEFGYEPLENFPDGRESDEFDGVSRHCLVRHHGSHVAGGCVRLVPGAADALMPFEKHCGHSLNKELLARMNLPRQSVCEISRLAVHAQFRRRAGEAESRFGAIQPVDFTAAERRVLPFISVSLFLAATVLTELEQRRNVFAMMEPFLPRLLKRAGLEFIQVGKTIDYHGERAAYFITTDSALSGMKPELRALYEIVKSTMVQPLRVVG